MRKATDNELLEKLLAQKPVAESLKASIHVFDVDHTITVRSTGIRMASLGRKHGHIRLKTILTFPFYYMRYRRGSYTSDTIPKFLPPLRGFSEDLLRSWGQEAFDTFVKFDIFEEATLLIGELKKQGKEIILCSSSLEYIIRPLAEFLGVEHILCTELALDDKGVTTGRIAGMPAFGDEKVTKVKSFLESRNDNPAEIAFWSDSSSDLPLLAYSRYPVPTNPDKRLRAECIARSWDWVEFSTLRG